MASDFPLWTVIFDRMSEEGYAGVWGTRGEAEAFVEESRRDGETREPTIERCRRVRPSEVLHYDLDRMVEEWDESPEPLSARTFARWEDEIVTLKPGAEEAFREWMDKFVDVSMHEPEPEKKT